MLMSVPLSIALALCLLSVTVGFLTDALVRRRFPRNDSKTPVIANAPDRAQMPDHSEIDRRMSSLFELTSHVGSQVSQHSLRVSEITDSMERPDDSGTTPVLVAGTLLITANQKLQSDLEEAEQEIQLQRDQMASYMQESRTDALTCLPNRRAFEHEMIQVLAQYRRDGGRFSLMVIDLDHFKRINDQYGHMVGDQLLKSFSNCLARSSRDCDFVARYGGEEFVAILPRTSIEEACKAAERIRSAIALCSHKVSEFELQITASIGVKEVSSGEADKELFEAADKALYATKHAGRNCCYYHDGTTCHRCVTAAASVESNSELPTSPPTAMSPDTKSIPAREQKIFPTKSQA